MNFSTAQKVLATIQSSDEVERRRASNRQRVNDLFNGAPMTTEAEAAEMNLHVNFNSGEGVVLAHHARRQYNTAFLQPSNFFKVKLPVVAKEHESMKLTWELWITQQLNHVLKNSLPFFEVFRQKFASVVAHGLGPQIWHDNEHWLPEYVAIEDLRVATDTELSLRNLTWFAVRKEYTYGELVKKVFPRVKGRHTKYWNRKAVIELLKSIKDLNQEITDYTWDTQPEKMAERIKQDIGYWMSDAIPKIPLWHFYYLDDDDPTQTVWRMKVVPDTNAEITNRKDPEQFIYDGSKEVFARNLSHILHIQFGDLSSKAPFQFHSIRSLGFLLVEPCFWSDLVRCRLLQHTFEAFNIWLKSSDPQGKQKAKMVDLYDRCFVPEGVTVVPQNERHQIDPNLVQMVQAQMRQLMQEAATSYTQDIDSGTQKEKTATETMALVQRVNALMGGLLFTAFMYERFNYKEICRRFCLRKSQDPDVRRFQESCKKYGIPAIYLNEDLWDVQPEVPLGNGNPTMELMQAQQLMTARGAHSSEAQQEILHIYDAAVTGNPQLASRLAPLGESRGVTDAQEHAELAFSTLMLGVPVRPKKGLNPAGQIETCIGLMAGVVARIEQTGNMARQDEIIGLQNVAQYISGLMQTMAEDEANKPRLKAYADALGKLMNSVKGFAQRLQQAQRKQLGNGNGDGGEGAMTQGKVQAMVIAAQTKAKIKEAEAVQKMHHKDVALAGDQQRKNLATVGEIQRRSILSENDKPDAQG